MQRAAVVSRVVLFTCIDQMTRSRSCMHLTCLPCTLVGTARLRVLNSHDSNRKFPGSCKVQYVADESGFSRVMVFDNHIIPAFNVNVLCI
jgi:hypothetical protein